MYELEWVKQHTSLSVQRVRSSCANHPVASQTFMACSLYTSYVSEFIVNVSVSTGIMLDPVYTGKGVRGMVLELQKTPSRFQGKRILFLHTGTL